MGFIFSIIGIIIVAIIIIYVLYHIIIKAGASMSGDISLSGSGFRLTTIKYGNREKIISGGSVNENKKKVYGGTVLYSGLISKAPIIGANGSLDYRSNVTVPTGSGYYVPSGVITS